MKRKVFGADLSMVLLGAIGIGIGFVACSTPETSKVHVMDTPPGETSSSPGQNPYGQNPGTANYPIGAFPTRASPSPTGPPPRFSE